MAVAAPLAQRWLYGPGRDLLFGCGLLYAVLFALFAIAGPAARDVHPAYLIPLLMVLLSTPHYGATLLRVYENPVDRRAYAFFTVWVTIGLCMVFVAGVYVNWIGTAMLTLYLTWSPWHYTGQNYGIAVMFLRRRGIDIPHGTKQWLYASFILSYVLLFLVMHSRDTGSVVGNPFFENGGVHLAHLGIPTAFGDVAIPVVGVAYLTALGVAWAKLLRLASPRELLPVAALCLTQALWFSIPEAASHWNAAGGLDVIDFDYRTYYFSWIVFGHAVQYLWITSYFAKANGDFKGYGRYFGKALLVGNAAWMLPGILLTPDGIGSLSYDLGLGLLVASLVNLHHFILDGAIWKLRNNRVAKILIRSAPAEKLEASIGQGGSPWQGALVWGIAALLLMGAGVELYESQLRIPAAFERGDLAAASRSLDNMAWFAKDSAQARAELGREMWAAQDTEGALAEFHRSIELQRGVEAYAAVGEIHAAAGQWKEALDAYRAALAIEPSQATVMSLVGKAHLGLGQFDLAHRQFTRALAVAPNQEAARKGLAQIAQRRRNP